MPEVEAARRDPAGGTPITREGVELAYRLLLGRPPESEKAIEYGLSAGTVETFRAWIMAGTEFAQRLRAEHAPLRRMLLHEWQTPAPPPASVLAGKPRIVFLHIMKTAGSSLRARLEELAQGEPVWRRESDGLPGRLSPAELAHYRIVMGHFTIADARQVPPPRRIFTVLRDPAQRVVSQFHFLHRHRAEVVAARDMRVAGIARESTLEEFLANPNPEVTSVTRNVMTRTLAGDYRVVGKDRYAPPWRDPHDAVSGPQLLARALSNLFTLDYVAFVERLEQDRPKLMRALGLPDTGPLPRENTAETLNDILEERPPPVVTPAAEKLLQRLNDLDRQLYKLARQHYG
jgi:hypothetical protein